MASDDEGDGFEEGNSGELDPESPGVSPATTRRQSRGSDADYGASFSAYSATAGGFGATADIPVVHAASATGTSDPEACADDADGHRPPAADVVHEGGADPELDEDMIAEESSPSAPPPPKKASKPAKAKRLVSSPKSDSGGGPPKPENVKAWEQATRATVDEERQRAEQLMKTVLDLEGREAQRIAAQLRERQRQEAIEASRAERRRLKAIRQLEEQLAAERQADMRRAHQEMLQAKKDESNALKAATANFNRSIQMENEAEEIAERMKSMNDALRNLGNAICKCQKGMRMKFSFMLVCERRLAMRDEKPESEVFKDKVHEALEEELEVLKTSRDELAELIRSGCEVKAEIERTQVLLTTGPSRENVARRTESSAFSLPMIKQKLATVPTHQELIQNSFELVSRATKITHDSFKCLQRTEEECSRATAKVKACLDQRNAKTVELRRTIEHQRKQATSTIADASRRLALLKMRSHRTPETPRSAEETAAQLAMAEELVLELKRGKKRLEEDYRLKTSAFQIDRSCRTLTQVRAGAFPSKLGPRSVPGSPSGTQSCPSL